MNFLFNDKQQRGVTLIIALLFLLLVTLISVLSANNSFLGLKMSGNMQNAFLSFQLAEAGAVAALSLSNTVADPFDGSSGTQNPFDYFSHSATIHPLVNLANTSTDITVSTTLAGTAISCPRTQTGFSIDLFKCDHYDIRSQHSANRKGQTEIHIGVVKTLISSSAQ